MYFYIWILKYAYYPGRRFSKFSNWPVIPTTDLTPLSLNKVSNSSQKKLDFLLLIILSRGARIPLTRLGSREKSMWVGHPAITAAGSCSCSNWWRWHILRYVRRGALRPSLLVGRGSGYDSGRMPESILSKNGEGLEGKTISQKGQRSFANTEIIWWILSLRVINKSVDIEDIRPFLLRMLPEWGLTSLYLGL